VPYASQSREIKEKILQTNLERYGCKTPAQLPEVRAKITQTLYANSSQKASKQQRYINNLYQGILNFPVKYYCADVFLSNDNLIVEYDGSGHMLNVTMGRETIEEYNHKEIVRYNVLKNEGYKQMKIISKTDKLPQDSTLLQMLSEAKQYFSEYPNHSWCEYNLDTSTVRNAEHKDGIPYSFGELRKIKDSDLQNNNNTNLKGA
jgi:very-short-patch-repair endonuclease